MFKIGETKKSEEGLCHSVLILSWPASAPVDFCVPARLLFYLFVLEQRLGKVVWIREVSWVAELLICQVADHVWLAAILALCHRSRVGARSDLETLEESICAV